MISKLITTTYGNMLVRAWRSAGSFRRVLWLAMAVAVSAGTARSAWGEEPTRGTKPAGGLKAQGVCCDPGWRGFVAAWPAKPVVAQPSLPSMATLAGVAVMAPVPPRDTARAVASRGRGSWAGQAASATRPVRGID